MFTHDVVHHIRRAVLPLSLACSLVLGAALASPTVADTPEAWEPAPDTSVLGFLLVLVIIPLGASAVIALLAVLPSLAGDRGYEPGQSWRSESEWFGGPTQGVQAAEAITPEQVEARSQGTGGTSASW